MVFSTLNRVRPDHLALRRACVHGFIPFFNWLGSDHAARPAGLNLRSKIPGRS